MKIAALVYGEYREFDNVVDSWKIFESLDIDYYFSTWDTSNQFNSKLQISKEQYVNEQMIKFHLPNAIIDIKNEKKVIESNDILINGSSYKIYYHWKNLLRMLKDSNKTYDIIILIRPDIYLLWPYHSEVTFPSIFGKNIFEDIKNKNKIYSLKSTNICDDKFIIGEYSVIEKLINKCDEFTNNIHLDLWKYFNENEIKIVDHSYFIIAMLVRFNVFLDKDEHFFKFEKIHKNNHKNDIVKCIYEKIIEWSGKEFSPGKQTIWESPELNKDNWLYFFNN